VSAAILHAVGCHVRATLASESDPLTRNEGEGTRAVG